MHAESDRLITRGQASPALQSAPNPALAPVPPSVPAPVPLKWLIARLRRRRHPRLRRSTRFLCRNPRLHSRRGHARSRTEEALGRRLAARRTRVPHPACASRRRRAVVANRESDGRARLSVPADGRLLAGFPGVLGQGGVEFVRQPSQQSYGTVAVFKDLYGNLWDLVQMKE